MIVGLMDGGLAFCIQSLPQFTNAQTIVPVKEQITVNQRNGRQERIFVDLEAVYPTPETSGSEMSFEELRASSRGWLKMQWKPQQTDVLDLENAKSPDSIQQPPSEGEDLVLSQVVVEKLIIPRDTPILDENGAIKETSREVRSRRLKTMEVNETQISKITLHFMTHIILTEGSKNQVILSIRKEAETQSLNGAYHDIPHTCSY